MVQIKNIEQLNKHLDLWSNEKISKKPIGYILSLEGADSIVNMDYLEKSYESGFKSNRSCSLWTRCLCTWN